MNRNHWIRTATAGALLLLILTTACPAPQNTVFLRDPNLERAVRAELGQPLGLLGQADLARLVTLDAANMGIRDLSGLEYCTNLAWLDLDTNEISDITPLSNLSNLRTLNLDSNQIFDIEPLASLINLKQVSLFDNQIADIRPLVATATNEVLELVILDANTLGARAAEDITTLEGLDVEVLLVTESGGDSGE
jgi:hypothetical protein